MNDGKRKRDNRPLPRKRKANIVRLASLGVFFAAIIGMVVFAFNSAPSPAYVEQPQQSSSEQSADAHDESVGDAALAEDVTAHQGQLDNQSSNAQSNQPQTSLPAKTPAGIQIPEVAIPVIGAEYEPHDVLVVFEEGYSAADINAAIDASACTKPQQISSADMQSGYAVLKTADGYDVAHAMTQLGMLPQLSIAQPNFIYRAIDSDLSAGNIDWDSLAAGVEDELNVQSVSVNDPSYSQQWMLPSIDAPEAWEQVEDAEPVVVAVMDNGCQLNHEDLVNSYLRDSSNQIVQYDAYHNDDSVEPGNHGTHVAGIIAAEANNGKGVAGVSYNKAKILPIEVLDPATGRGSTSSLLAAFNYVLSNNNAHNVKVINMSLGGTWTYEAASYVTDNALNGRVNMAYNAGVLSVFAAGNDVGDTVEAYDPSTGSYRTITITGAYYVNPLDWASKALGVIALSNGNPVTRAYYSNYNVEGQNTKDISAPGTSIYSTVYLDSRTNTYVSYSGTSMACPCVAGVAALVYAKNPSLTPGEVSQIICDTAEKVNPTAAQYDATGFSLGYGYGEINAFNAVRAVDESFITGDDAVLKDESITLTAHNYVDGITWSSSNPAIATVENGVVTGKSAGTVTITAAGAAGKSASHTVTVYDAQIVCANNVALFDATPLSISCSPSAPIEQWRIEVSPENSALLVENPRDIQSDYYDFSGYTDDEYALIATDVGSISVSATLVSNPTIVISKQIQLDTQNIANATISPVENQVFTGQDIEPHPTVSYRGLDLTEGDEYTLSYGNNKNVSVFSVTKPTITITGTGEYFTGSTTVTFDITPATITAPTAQTGLVYNRTAQTGVAAGVGYRLSGTSTTTNAGTYTAYATLNDSANTTWTDGTTAQKTITWSISPKAITPTLSLSQSSFTYNRAVQKPTITVKDGTTLLATPSDYTVSYTGNCKDVDTYGATVTCTGNYLGTASTSYSITKAQLSNATMTLSQTYYTYDGGAKCPTATITLGGDTLSADTDYTLSYEGERNAGTATCIATGKGNYTGTKTATYTILPSNVTAPSAKTNLVYNCTEQTGVEPGIGYTLTGESAATDAGTYTAYAQLIDAAHCTWADGTTAQKTITWSISPKTIQPTLQLSSSTLVYNRAVQHPAVTVKDGSTTLSSDGDYSIPTYSDGCKNVGTYSVSVSCMGNYRGEASADFRITAASISTATMTVSPNSYTYDGKEKKPGATVRLGNVTLTNGDDYTLSYSNNRNPGTATCKATGKGNYTGSKQVTFRINKVTPKPSSAAMYRLYNPNSGEHFYTASSNERNYLSSIGWVYEGVAWNAPTSGSPVYRVYNPNTGDHHYTVSSSERVWLIGVGWNDEGVGWYSYSSSGKPLYRLYNPNALVGSHHYTTSASERNSLASIGWHDEGIGWYGM